MKVHKFLILTIKHKFIFDQTSHMILGKLYDVFQQNILDGKMFIELKDWDNKNKGQLIVEMWGTEEEVKAWTKKTLREKIGLGIARAGLKIDIVDA